MLDALSSIVNTITVLIQFLINSIQSLLDLIVHIPDYVTYLLSFVGLMPQVLIPFLIATISVYVILFILGR